MKPSTPLNVRGATLATTLTQTSQPRNAAAAPGVPPIRPFTGIPSFRSTALPSNPARFVNGKLRRVRDGIDMLLFGVARRSA